MIKYTPGIGRLVALRADNGTISFIDWVGNDLYVIYDWIGNDGILDQIYHQLVIFSNFQPFVIDCKNCLQSIRLVKVGKECLRVDGKNEVFTPSKTLIKYFTHFLIPDTELLIRGVSIVDLEEVNINFRLNNQNKRVPSVNYNYKPEGCRAKCFGGYSFHLNRKIWNFGEHIHAIIKSPDGLTAFLIGKKNIFIVDLEDA